MSVKSIVIVFITLLSFSQCDGEGNHVKIIPAGTKIKKSQLNLPDYIMLNHLAKISYKKNSFILHGKFSKSKNDFELKAFGDFDMLLFSIKYKDSLLSSRIHFDPLKEKNFNATHVGEDLWRIYFANSNTALKLFGINNKAFTESKIRLIYDRDNFLRKKLFYHNGKLIYKVIYKDYRKYYDIILPRIINCEHLVYKYKLKIITLTVNMAANK